MPALNSHSFGGASGGKAMTFFHTTAAGASMVMLVVTAITGGSNLAVCSANMASGRMATQAAKFGPAKVRLRRNKIDRAIKPPAMENGRANGTAIIKQPNPSRPRLNNDMPMRTGTSELTATLLSGERTFFRFRNQEAMNPVKNGTPRNRPQPYIRSTWTPHTASATPRTTAIATPKNSVRKFPVPPDLLAAEGLVIGFVVLGASVSQRKSNRFA